MTNDELTRTVIGTLVALIVLVVLQIAADVVIYRKCAKLLREARKVLDMAAMHGRVTDSRLDRREAEPKVVDPPSGRGCGTAGAVLVAGAVAVGWAQDSAADEMRREGTARALAELRADSR